MGFFDIYKRKKNDDVLCSKFKRTVPPLNDPHILPTRIEDFKEWHIKVLRRLDKHLVNEPFSGLMASEVDIPNFIPILQQLNLIDLAPYNEALLLLKNDILKQILGNNGLKVTGNKQELVNRILHNISEMDVINSDEYSEFYILTDKGREIVSNSYMKFEVEHIEFFRESINLIMSNKINEAYRKICKRNAEMPVPPGLNCDWKSWYYSGLSDKLRNIYADQLKNSDNMLLTAASIFEDMSGDSLQAIQFYLKHGYNIETAFADELRFHSKLLSTDRNFTDYNSFGIEQYKFLTAIDDRVCPICKELNGKIFFTKDRKIGINCPPIHSGCRCTTVAVVDIESI